MQLTCPKCGAKIGADGVNVAADVAKCAECGDVFRPGDLMPATESDVEAPDTGPDGAGPRPPADCEVLIIASDADAFEVAIYPGGVFHAPLVLPALFSVCVLALFAGEMWENGQGTLPVLAAIFGTIAVLCCLPAVAGGTESQNIRLTASGLTITRKNVFGTRKVVIPLTAITSVYSTVSLHARRSWTAACVSHEGTRTWFAQGATETDMEWIVAVLKARTFQITGRLV